MHRPSEPPRPTPAEVDAELAEHVRALAGPDAVPRPDQIAAVTAVVAERRRTLLVARTGFGKSAVYFSATRMLRDRGWGPTIVVSPLLALMRDQVAAAERLGLAAVTINSSNIDAWSEIERRIAADEIDLLLIAPERLANAGFRRRVFDTMQSRAFALVCDEAHCISDWGHDFRPDYRRLRRVLADLPAWTPVLATTATANQRVTDDVAAQLGADTLVLRTSLERASLRLSVVDLPDDAHRLAWLAETLGELPGSGIVYCLTVDQAESTAAWLRARGLAVAAYTGSVESEQRLELERALRTDELKALVATSALGMGFDKGDLAFCVHLGLPPTPVAYTGSVESEQRLELERALRTDELKALVATSALGMGFDKGDLAFCVHLGLPPTPVAYYQQIGRAGRSIDRAEVIALPRPTEDAAIWRWFESVSLPSEQICRSVLDQLDTTEPTSIAALEPAVNLGRSRLGILLSILDVDGAIERIGGGYIRTDEHWRYDHELVASLRQLRRDEADQMLHWAELRSCRLRFLRASLDDETVDDCGRCDRCTDATWRRDPDPLTVAAAQQHLRGADIVVEPRRQWPTGLDEPRGRIAADRQPEPGRALARLGDGGWNPIVSSLIDAADADDAIELPDELVTAVAALLKRWDWPARPTWVCPVPSRRRGDLVDGIAQALGALGKLPIHRALVDRSTPDHGFQAEQANSAHQVTNVWRRFEVDPAVIRNAPSGPVLVVDDEIDSRWTMTVAAWQLTGAGGGPVLPVALRSR